jgi:hypothetical protein
VTSADKRYIWVKQPLAISGATLVTSFDKRYICMKQPLSRSGATLVTSVDKHYIWVKQTDVAFIERSHECRSTNG